MDHPNGMQQLFCSSLTLFLLFLLMSNYIIFTLTVLSYQFFDLRCSSPFIMCPRQQDTNLFFSYTFAYLTFILISNIVCTKKIIDIVLDICLHFYMAFSNVFPAFKDILFIFFDFPVYKEI